MRRTAKGFVIGSSLPATLWPLVGLGYEGRDLVAGAVDWYFVGLFFPILFGLTNALSVNLGLSSRRRGMALIGAVMGLVSASVGTFGANIPEIVYGLHGNARYLALLGGPVFYGAVWALPVYSLNEFFEFGETARGRQG